MQIGTSTYNYLPNLFDFSQDLGITLDTADGWRHAPIAVPPAAQVEALRKPRVSRGWINFAFMRRLWPILLLCAALAPFQARTAELTGSITVSAGGVEEILPDGNKSMPLKRVKVHLWVIESHPPGSTEALIVAPETAWTDDEGVFTFDLGPDAPAGGPVVPISYAIMVILESEDMAVAVHDQENDYFKTACLATREITADVRGVTRADIVLTAKKKNTVEGDSDYSVRAFDFRPIKEGTGNPPIQCNDEQAKLGIAAYDTRGTTNTDPERFAHLAILYARAYNAYEFVRDGLGKPSFAPVRVVAWVPQRPEIYRYGCLGEIMVGKDVSFFFNPDKDSRVTAMRHEYGHHFMCASTIAGADNLPLLAPGDTNHNGLVNTNSRGAWTEGFATYFASAVAEHHGEHHPNVQEVKGGASLNLATFYQIDDPELGGEQQTNDKLSEEFATASLLWEASYTAGSDTLLDLLSAAALPLNDLYEVYKEISVNLPIDYCTPEEGVDCLFIKRGFYHDRNGNGLYDSGEEVGRTRWPLITFGPGDFRPEVPVLDGSMLRIDTIDGTGQPVAVDGFKVEIRLDAPLEHEDWEYVKTVSGDGPYEFPILLPANSHAVITPIMDDYVSDPPLIIESDFFAERVNSFRSCGVEPILAEHTFTLRPGVEVFETGAFILVGKTRVGRTTFEYSYEVELINNGPPVAAATALVTSADPHTVIVDEMLEFGEVPENGSAMSEDTFTLRQDRRFPFDAGALSFSFSSSP